MTLLRVNVHLIEQDCKDEGMLCLRVTLPFALLTAACSLTPSGLTRESVALVQCVLTC